MVTEKTYIRATTIEEAISAAHAHRSDFCYVAGGTDVLVNKYQGNKECTCLVDLMGIEALRTIVVEGQDLKIGSLVRLEELKNNAHLAKNFPALLIAAHEVASPVIRKSATIGGNILCENRCSFYNQSEWWREAIGYCLKCDGDVCIATGGKKACFSKFVSDTAPVLISVGAKLEFADIDGTKVVDLETIYTGDGIKPRNIPGTSILKSIILPLDMVYKVVFKKLRPRQAVDFTSLTTAVSVNENGDLRIVVGGVDPKPVLVTGTVKGNIKDYIKTALSKARVVDNDYYSRKYRREMMSLFLEQSFEELSRLFFYKSQ
jgi:4-hydroxybenzoyl-CoA reductase subunit beta